MYLITDPQIRNLLAVVEEALKGGVDAVQLRADELPEKEFLDMARSLRKLTASCNALFFINDRINVAQATGADGIHLKSRMLKDSLPTGLKERFLIGFSTHSLKEGLAAKEKGADFITAGPVFETPSKLEYGQPIGLAALREINNKTGLPVFALGGITVENCRDVMDSGVEGVAMISYILNAGDPGENAARIKGIIEFNKAVNPATKERI